MKQVLRSACVVVVSSSLTLAAWRLLRWRARKRAGKSAEKVESMAKPGPLVSSQFLFQNRAQLSLAIGNSFR